MNITLITKEKLGVISRRVLKYPLHISEKDYFLTIGLKIIAESSLKDRLLFKGGTALHHFYLPQYRFSEDLDFVSTGGVVTVKELEEVFKKYSFFNIKKIYTSKATVKIERLQYSGVLDQPNYLKIDVSNINNVILKPQRLKYINAWDIDINIDVMDIREICAEKISATSGRIRYRDFYDLYLIINELGIKVKDALEILKQKELEKPVYLESILTNWNIAKKEKHSDLTSIHIKKEVADTDMERFLKEIKLD